MASLEVFFQRFETLLGIVNSMTSWLSVSKPNKQDAASLSFNEFVDLYMGTINVTIPLKEVDLKTRHQKASVDCYSTTELHGQKQLCDQ